MNGFEKLDASNAPGLRKRLRILATTTQDELERELSEHLLKSWHFTEGLARLRELIPLLLLELEVITDTDLMKGGRDGAAFRNRALRRQADELLKTGRARNKREAAKILSKAPNQKLELGTIIKLLSVPKSDAARKEAPLEPRSIRRQNDHARVVRALEIAVARLEKNYELTGLVS
jgi:hypothetical protein